MTTDLVPGSLGAIARETGRTLAETFLSADVIILIDTSASMNARDVRNGRRRYDVACEELAALQAKMPGKIAVVTFSDQAVYTPYGIPPYLGRNTDLAGALKFVQPADGTVQFVVISDGRPNDEDAALRIARTFASRINAVYVGPELGYTGMAFLQQLAQAAGGRYTVAATAHQLSGQIQNLLSSGR